MEKMKVLVGTLLVATMIGGASLAFAGNGNGNGPNSGSGGNGQNNGNGNSVWINHHHGNGTWSLMQVPPGAVAGHAAHGDIWYYSGCPLTGSQFACWE
jgi:hypothetical protein